MAAFPLVKLGYLALRQISKPLANYIKRRAKANPFFRTYICIPPAQIYHWSEINIRLRLMGLGRAKNVEPLSEKEAIELGGDMLGEFLIFAIAAVLMVSEYQRSARKEQAKEEKLNKEKRKNENIIQELASVTEIQKAQIRELQQSLDRLTAEYSKVGDRARKNTGLVNKIFSSKES